MRKLFYMFVILTLSGCAISRHTQTYRPLDMNEKSICIVNENESNVNINTRSPFGIPSNTEYHELFKVELAEELQSHGFYVVSRDTQLKSCYYKLKYEVTYDWNIVNYISNLKLTILHGKDAISSASYYTEGGALNLQLWYKYRRPKTIIKSLLDMMIKS